MCGIAGIFSDLKIDSQKLVKMTDAISHRGPDGQGLWLNDTENLAFGHRRLSIIDLSEEGKQPMHFGDRYVITFNGEIYNYLELRQELILKGVKFKSKTDTEVLLALFAEFGEACLQKLEGMFAFVIYDKQTKTLFGARDRFGEKPFYYSYEPNKLFVFASEIKALFAFGIQKDINNKMLANFLVSNYSISDPKNLQDTFYNNILKLPAANYFTVNANLELDIKEYWKIDPSAINEKITFNEAKEEFKYLLLRSVEHRLRSDVPIGSSLSGGLDSSSIVCLINEINKDKSIKQNTFSARFKDFNKDEGQFIQYILNKTNATPHFTWPNEEDFIKDFDDLIYYQDEPFPSASIYAQYCVMKKAKEENVTVLLDGQGADEILAGYEYYLQTYLNGIKTNNNYSSELELIEANNANFVLEVALEKSVNKKLSLKNLAKDLARPVYKTINPKKYKKLSSNIKQEGLLSSQFEDSMVKNWKYDFSYDQQNVKKHLWFSVKNHNLEDLLRFSDRNSMAHGREVRLAFLNTQLVEFLFTLPPEFLINKGWTKYILREAMKEILPPEITWRKDKIGYEPPQKKWMQNNLFVEKVKEGKEFLSKQNIINKDHVFTEDNNWSVLMARSLFAK